MQGLEFWVGIYHEKEEAIQGITDEHMFDGFEECRNVAIQKTLPIPISDVEANCAK